MLTVFAAVGMLAVFFVMLIVKHYRSTARQRQQLLLAMVQTQENERKRIAEDMHDGLGQLLAAVKLQVDGLTRASQNDLVEEVSNVKSLLDQTVTEVRNVIRDLVPKRIESDGLVMALEELCRYANEEDGTTIRFNTIGNYKPVNVQLETNIYRIAQELIHNAVKHANANSVQVELQQTDNKLLVTVTDDGRGMPVETNADGNGLHNLRSRANLYNGDVVFTPNAPSGTRARVTLHQPVSNS